MRLAPILVLGLLLMDPGPPATGHLVTDCRPAAMVQYTELQGGNPPGTGVYRAVTGGADCRTRWEWPDV